MLRFFLGGGNHWKKWEHPSKNSKKMEAFDDFHGKIKELNGGCSSKSCLRNPPQVEVCKGTSSNRPVVLVETYR